MNKDKLDKIIKAIDCKIKRNCNDCPFDADFNCIGCDVAWMDDVKKILLKMKEEGASNAET